MTADKSSIIFCQCDNSEIISATVKQRIEKYLREAKIDYLDVPDLCGAAARKDPALPSFLAADELIIIACHPRAVQGLVQAAGISPSGKKLTFLNMRKQSADEIIAALPSCADSVDQQVQPVGGWRPWFPIIDEDRCSNCGQCLDFCLFGVYERDADGKVKVTNPASCKNKCPACARICPQVAIMFPKLAEAPVNGAEVDDECAAQAQVKLNIEEMLGEDVYAVLAKRKNTRKKLLRRQNLEQAIEERAECAGQDELAESADCGCVGDECQPDQAETEACGCEAENTASAQFEKPPECECGCDCGPDSECCADCEIKCFYNPNPKCC